MKQTLLSGIAPSGELTLDNYLGAVSNWVSRKDQYECFFPLVDLHAITVRRDPESFASRCRDFVALYLASGKDPDKSTLFIQSHVPEHCEIAWILQRHTQPGELSHMNPFKDKGGQNSGSVNAGLFSYPALMAADIVLHKANLVPVGEDQRQHLKLTRDVARRFNGVYGPVFEFPEAFMPDSGARIMSLQDPSKKMSKSDTAKANVISLFDAADVIKRKIKRCVTDSGNEVVHREDQPGISNLLNILSAISGYTVKDLEDQYRGRGYDRFKSDVANAVIAGLGPIQTRFAGIRSDELSLGGMLADGAISALEKAQKTLKELHSTLGFIPRPR
ncbi:MAG: tryptophanyl-tRNA synthetase [Candidatus Azotimanducaceae bacterium]|jgi:tryptophanyl-tRNA synthetase